MTTCPTCHKNINCTAGFGLPKTGDYTICVYCRSVSIFTDTMSLELYKTFDQLDFMEQIEMKETLERFVQVMNRENN